MSELELIDRLRNQVDHLADCVWAEGATESLAAFHAVTDTMMHLAPELVRMGIQQGLTQKRIADLLDMPASSLRGAKREFAA